MRDDVQFVCFDLGGVIVRICRTYREALGRAGIDESKIHWPPLDELPAVMNAYQRGEMNGCDYSHAVSRLVRGSLTPNEVLRVHDAVILEPYADVDVVVNRLNELPIRTAALSNINDRHWPLVREIRAIRRLDHHVLSHEIGAIKPDESAYIAVEEIAECDPSSILFFDDTFENIEAGRSRGWQCVHVDYDKPTAPQIRSALRNAGIQC